MKALIRKPIKGKEGKCEIALLLSQQSGYAVEETHFTTDGHVASSKSSGWFVSKTEAEAFMARQEDYLIKTPYSVINESDY